ncbi:MAG: hypothetical protein K2O18_00805 [Oscillospiraceae bacterium]|nr:hypothetical protein [Oscillospiraceae bacterium]
MKHKLTVLLLALFLLTGCSIAQPEAVNPASDRFAGFYVVYNRNGSGSGWNDNPALTEYGSWTADTEFGKISVPRQVLVAEERDNQYIFPGLEGYSLFLVSGTEPDGSVYTECVSDMAPGSEGISTRVGDEGTSNLISGVIYTGPPQGAAEPDANGHFMAYRVYQSPDGAVYLDGSGNGFTGGGSSYWETQSYTTTKNGESTTDTIEVKVTVKSAPRLERLTVSQFDGQNSLLSSDGLAPGDDLPEIRCLPEAAWILIEEQSADGTVRTVYNKPENQEEPVYHTVVLLDDAGLGRTTDLQIFG